MKIRDIRCTLLRFPAPPGVPGTTASIQAYYIFHDLRERRMRGTGSGYQQMLLVEVLSDEGITGWHYTSINPRACRAIILESLRDAVVDLEPFQTESLWDRMFRITITPGRKGLVMDAISVVDIAIWDLLGKTLGQPVYNLLGGKTRDKIRVYASHLYPDISQSLKDKDGSDPHVLYDTAVEVQTNEAREYVRQGFTAMKFRFAYGPSDGLPGIRKNVEIVRAIREAIGYDIELAADGTRGWNSSYALEMIPHLEEFELKWLEEPTLPDDIDGYVAISKSTRIPIAGGEHEYTRWGFKELLERGAVRILQPDTERSGGIGEVRKICTLASAYGLPVIPHGSWMSNFHLVISQMNCPMAEYFPYYPDSPISEIVLGIPRAERGYVSVPDRPGLGLDLDRNLVEKYTVEI